MKAYGWKWLLCSLVWVASVGHAQTVHKTALQKSVDLEAAAKATTALYADMTVPQAAAPAAKPAPALAVPAVKPPLMSSRSSPLLPPVAAHTAPAAAPAAMGEVWQGAYQCAHAEKVQLRPDTVPEQVELQWKGQRWKLRRIDSLSGAMRLEDASARMVWIQLGNKSMLLDQQQGKRLLDECLHAVQVQTAAQMKTNPPPALFDTTGMGR